MADEKIKVIEWETEDCGEGPLVYRLDEAGEGDRFFQHVLDNAELDGRERFTLKEMTKEEWAECEKRGEDSA